MEPGTVIAEEAIDLALHVRGLGVDPCGDAPAHPVAEVLDGAFRVFQVVRTRRIPKNCWLPWTFLGVPSHRGSILRN